jgi:hypothetical protein
MDESHSVPPRVRMQALRAIPDRERTDAEWDELNELEIMLAAGNRESAPDQSAHWNRPPPGGPARPNGGQPRANNGPHGRNSGKRFHQRPPKRHTP